MNRTLGNSSVFLTSRYCVDFGASRRIVPTYYTFRYGSSGAACCPRNWQLQGAVSLPADWDKTSAYSDVDSKSWTILRAHENDSTIASSHAAGSWPVNSPSTQGYRFLRVIQTGPNSFTSTGDDDAWSNVLVASGFEVYGDIIEQAKLQDSILQDINHFSTLLHTSYHQKEPEKYYENQNKLSQVCTFFFHNRKI